MKRTLAELAEFVGGRLSGDAAAVVESIAALDTAGPADLSYAEPRFSEQARASRAGCLLVGAGEFPGRNVIVVSRPKLAFARAAAWLAAPETAQPGVHAAAVVAADATLGHRVTIGAGSVVEAGAWIGNDSVIRAGCFIGANVRIGEACLLYPRVVLYSGVELKNRIILHSGVVIGADGFGFVFDGERQVKFPQAGGVIINDDVEIGANTCVDRGSLGTTIIGRGVKIDNLCQIAHNVRIGEHTVIAAQTGISGSCTIGARAIIGGQVGMGDHVRIDDGAIIGSGSGILTGKRLRGGETYWGTPARPLREIKRQIAWLSHESRLATRDSQGDSGR